MKEKTTEKIKKMVQRDNFPLIMGMTCGVVSALLGSGIAALGGLGFGWIILSMAVSEGLGAFGGVRFSWWLIDRLDDEVASEEM